MSELTEFERYKLLSLVYRTEALKSKRDNFAFQAQVAEQEQAAYGEELFKAHEVSPEGYVLDATAGAFKPKVS